MPVPRDAMPDYFYKRLRLVVEQNGGPEMVAKTSNVLPGRIEEILREAPVSLYELIRICYATDTPASWLLEGKGFGPLDQSTIQISFAKLAASMDYIEAKRTNIEVRRSLTIGAWENGNLRAVFELWEEIFKRLPPRNYKIVEIVDNVMAPALQPNDLAVVVADADPTKPGIYLFRRGFEHYFARLVPTAGVLSVTFDNPGYIKTRGEAFVTLDEHTRCVGPVVAVFGPPR
jgi:hypothetical protein